MTSYNTVVHPTRASNVTNVNGDHLTFRDIIILHYHAGPSTSPDRDRANAGATGASAGDESSTLPRAAQHADVAASVTPIPFNALYNVKADCVYTAIARLTLEAVLESVWAAAYDTYPLNIPSSSTNGV